MKIKMQLSDVIKSDKLLSKTGLNPYCVNEGTNGKEYIILEVEDSLLSDVEQKAQRRII
jgi:hypothetical protein